MPRHRATSRSDRALRCSGNFRCSGRFPGHAVTSGSKQFDGFAEAWHSGASWVTSTWAPSTYTAEGYEGVRRTATYRGDLHVLVQAPDGTMAASTIMWLDEANKTAEFEPVGTHPGYRRLGLGTAMLRHGMHLAREAGATHMTVACAGAPGHPEARGLYYGAGFRPFTRDAPLIKPAV